LCIANMVRLTLGHVGHLVLAHGLESLFLHLALHLWGDTEEVEVASSQGYQAGEDGEDADRHSKDGEKVGMREVVCIGIGGAVLLYRGFGRLNK
jgi:hypothetical protein